MQHIFLIPGFFGFANLGKLKYFAHVREILEATLERHGCDAEIHYVPTLPTASLRRRAARLLDTIAEVTPGNPDSRGDHAIHLVGHSSGGLDARLLASPGVSLPSKHDPEPYAARIRSVVSIASPHHGTPQVTLFTSVLGLSLLRVLSVTTLHSIRLGSVPISALLALAGTLRAHPRFERPVVTILDQIYRQVLHDFDDVRQKELEDFFATTGTEPALVAQLSPAGMDVFNAATTRRPETRYGCVVAQGRPPGWRETAAIGLSPTAQAMYALYRALHELASEMPDDMLPILTPAQSRALTRAFDALPGPTANDAIVPTLSQVWGEVIHATWADHHDVIGHFADPGHDPPHVDWLATRSGFNRRRFEQLWERVAMYLIS